MFTSRLPSVYLSHMPTVAIARMEGKRHSFDSVLSQVREALKDLGGMEAFVKPGESVLFRPDQSVAMSAEGGSTTDPLVVGALIRLARHAGAAKLQVAASSSGFSDSLECMKSTGMAEIAAREGAELVDLGSDLVPNREVDLAEGKILHRAPLPVPLLEADVIIAVPKAKTHYLDVIAGVVEVALGAVNQNWRALNIGADDMIGRFADIMTVVRPDLYVTDALICGEGDGPVANVPRWCGCIAASTDAAATDISIALLMELDWKKLRFAAALEERALGSREPIVWLGTRVERVAFRAWPSHDGFGRLPVNVLVGDGVTLSGTTGHVKTALDDCLNRGILGQVISKRGVPTIMIGDVEDPEFEQHIAEGPYIVFDNAARPQYKSDPRVFFVPGHPVLHTAMPQLFRGLGAEFAREGRARLQPGAVRRENPGSALHWPESGAVARYASIAVLAISAVLGIRALARRD